MKKIVFVAFLILLTSIHVFSQITIKKGDMPQKGGNYYYATTTTKIDTDTTGANVTWDYSNLKPSQADTAIYSTPSGIYALVFYGSLQNKVYNFGQNSQSFFTANDSGWYQTGIGLNFNKTDAPIQYSDKERIYKFPMSYKDKWVDSFYGGLKVTGYGFSVKGKLDASVDGYGTLTTPFGKFDVIRVKTVYKQSYTITVSGFGFPLPYNYTEYRWLAKGKQYPILQVVTNGFTQTVTYMDSSRVINNTAIADPDFTVAPADSNIDVGDSIKFTNNSTNTKLTTTYNWGISPGTIGTDWDFAAGSSGTSQSTTIKFLKPGKYSIRLVTGAYFQSQTKTKTKTDYINVTIPASPEVDFSADKVLIAPGKIVTFTDLSKNKPKSWRWTITPTTFTYVSGTDTISQNPKVIFNSEGKYTVKLVASNGGGNGNSAKSDFITVDKSVGIEGLLNVENDIQVYPNPTTGNFKISINKIGLKNLQYKILALDGKCIQIGSINGSLTNIEFNQKGCYYIMISNDKVYSLKTIVITD